MKRFTALITAFILLFSPFSAVASDAVVSISSASGTAEELISVSLSIKGTGALSGVCLEISYDDQKLSYISFVKGANLTAEHCHVSHIESGKLRITFTDSRNNYIVSGPVLYLKFKPIANATGIAYVTPLVTDGALFDRDYIELEYSVESGSITLLPQRPPVDFEIKGGLIYLNSTYTAEELSMLMGGTVSVEQDGGYVGSGCCIYYLGSRYYTVYRGDINGDAFISTADYLAVRGYLCGVADLSYACVAACDTNGDGIHGTADLLVLRRGLAADKT